MVSGYRISDKALAYLIVFDDERSYEAEIDPDCSKIGWQFRHQIRIFLTPDIYYRISGSTLVIFIRSFELGTGPQSTFTSRKIHFLVNECITERILD